jgi:hypothetical protein
MAPASPDTELQLQHDGLRFRRPHQVNDEWDLDDRQRQVASDLHWPASRASCRRNVTSRARRSSCGALREMRFAITGLDRCCTPYRLGTTRDRNEG